MLSFMGAMDSVLCLLGDLGDLFCQVILGHFGTSWGWCRARSRGSPGVFFSSPFFPASVMSSTEVVLSSPSFGKMGGLDLGGAGGEGVEVCFSLRISISLQSSGLCTRTWCSCSKGTHCSRLPS